ncbi:MAG: F0F1 ATP synthase subunit delta [Hyphomicrobiaceae bacterium]|nr:F0F1 ATP synthase subunit delta [Hyphomicrobiaceae bacterium]MCC0023720.1 F0F1 ATP synthase subunit delta [Hyphomicrobiaceae bacterium]
MSASSSALAQIARPYANALFDLGKESGSLGDIEGGLDSISALVNDSSDFADFLKSPLIDTEEKAKAMNAILDKVSLPALVSNFVKTAAGNGRLFALPAMIAAFKELAAAERGEMRAEVTSASELTKAQLDSLAATLKDKFGKDVALDTNIDPSLIGGLVVKVGSRMIDTSLKTKLTAMKVAMKEVG